MIYSVIRSVKALNEINVFKAGEKKYDFKGFHLHYYESCSLNPVE